MNDNPLVIIISALVALYILKIYRDDYRAFQTGTPNPKAMPGATPAPMWLIWIAALGSLLLVGVETAGEYALGITDEQSTIGAFYLIAMVSAGIVEEVVFRGFLVVKRTRAMLIGSIVFFSLLFALVHMHLLETDEEGTMSLVTGAGPLWWTFILFLNSIWWYAVRFLPGNRHQSLFPCFAGHIASNLGVFAVKLAQGYVTF